MKSEVVLLKLFSFSNIINRKMKPKNILKKDGIKSKVSGIKNLKLSSKVREIDIQ